MTEELKAKASALREDIASIKQQISEARHKADEFGMYADPKWWARAHDALRHKRRELEEIEQAVIESRARPSYQESFIQAARDLLDANTFNRISAKAKQRGDTALGSALLNALRGEV